MTRTMEADATDAGLNDTVALLQAMIREACVNDGSVESGQEVRNVNVLQRFLAGAVATGRLEVHVYASAPGRSSLIARVRGTDPDAPALGLVGHLDVVPVNPDGWSRNPFGGELIDGEIWGRGAVDMLYLTAAFATVLRDAALSDTPLRGDLVLLAVADEEAGSEHGIHWLLREHAAAVHVTEAISESGGMRMGRHVAIEVAEKGSAGRRLVVHGTPGHASIPYGAAGAVTRMGEVLNRLSSVTPIAQLGPLWAAFVNARIDDPELAERMLDPVRLDAVLPKLGGIAGYAHAISRITISPTILRSGHTHNVIPSHGELDLDIRTLPGTTDAEVDELLRAMLGDLADAVEIEHLRGWPATASPATTPLFAAIERAVTEVSGEPVVPIMAAGGSDNRVLRGIGIPAYGFGLLGPEWSYEKYREGVHGNNERIDLGSIGLTLAALRRIVADRVG
ncbi:acetylornithine deacetylase/succinyl-diaminopimelate desuccinylase-like protein [Leucobacter exalbidus]|uniref:Acetylornithine deacetylase/succinyl-diaminopimelate desuccinylase-like protein n=1 Tax=Leucobacter exalbidus TaxID=662960 RepID=A0A940T3M7_9MICO|nr:acetylornithine deacetylase/succinyl-diaminopimelate desuccinylase-like protein [Leucobacter exalbidus]